MSSSGFGKPRLGSHPYPNADPAIRAIHRTSARLSPLPLIESFPMLIERVPLLLVPVVAALVTASCSPPPAAADRAAEAAAIRSSDEQWSATAARNDLGGTIAFYAEDAVLLPPNAPIATNANAIRASWAELLSPGAAISWKVTKVQVAQSGELGYLYGTYSVTMPDPKGGPPAHDAGKMVEIWRKQPDGKWKCIVDTYNSDLPATPPAETKK